MLLALVAAVMAGLNGLLAQYLAYALAARTQAVIAPLLTDKVLPGSLPYPAAG